MSSDVRRKIETATRTEMREVEVIETVVWLNKADVEAKFVAAYRDEVDRDTPTWRSSPEYQSGLRMGLARSADLARSL